MPVQVFKAVGEDYPDTSKSVGTMSEKRRDLSRHF